MSLFTGPSLRRILLLAALLGLFSVPCTAQNLNTNAALLKVNLVESVWHVNADATHTLEVYVEREALSDAGAQVVGKFAQAINKALQSYEVIEAYTLKADGRRLQVERDGVQVQRGIATGGTGLSWPEAEVHQITFPNLQKGDKAIWRSRLKSHTPVLPDWSSYAEFGVPNVIFDKMTVKIEAPQSLGLNVFASGWKQDKTQSGQQEIWQFEFTQAVAKVVDSNPANTLVTYPRIYASTLKSHAELAAAYAQQANANALLTDAVKALASKIIEGKTTPVAKAAAVHDWVRKNIRYVAVYLGTGGWVPHEVDWILKNRYGDCKDHALLLQTLLKAVDIEAVPVLINTTNEYALAELPIGFVHCIVYIPSLNLFVDPTDNRIPFGALPWADSDKPVAVALNDGARVMRTPAFMPSTNRLTIKTQLDIAKTGKATGSIELDATGFAATTLQDRLAQIPNGMEGVAVQKILEGSGLRGRGFMQYPAVQHDVQGQTLKIVNLEIDNLLGDASAGSINPHPTVNLPVYVLSNMGNYTAPRRDFAFTCTPVQVREEFEVRFDPAFQLLRVPANFKESQPDGIAFEAHYARDGNTIKGWREMTLSHTRHSCSAEDYAARKPVMNRIAQHLRSAVLFQQ